MLFARFHFWCEPLSRDVIFESLSPDWSDSSFEKRATTTYSKSESGFLVHVEAEDEKALNASLHFAIKNISFLQKIVHQTRRL
ncbi:MAG: hypothetical protein J4215_04520 [Candidatus Diapherotrites archaeon]|uniref:Uncharacterized protein n=1 Tax=Candidatus Iainarchaeum sp. TaxID=3101447 RepID=A0A8T4L3B6_9ARCH|nr:hypothetical protein [Candidatus Diapherotrites archaeon]